jgi:hypothetical protein
MPDIGGEGARKIIIVACAGVERYQIDADGTRILGSEWLRMTKDEGCCDTSLSVKTDNFLISTVTIITKQGCNITPQN